MDKIKGLDCPLKLTIQQWADVLKCLKKHHSDGKAILDLEHGLRSQVDTAFDLIKGDFCKEIFGIDLEDTQELPVVKLPSPVSFGPGIEFIEDDEDTVDFVPETPIVQEEECGLLFDEDDEYILIYNHQTGINSPVQFGVVDLGLMCLLTGSVIGFVCTLLKLV